MNKPAIFFLPGMSVILCLAACGERASDPAAGSTADSSAPAPAPENFSTGESRELTAEERKQVLDGLMQARVRQQAEGLGSGSVKVNGAWHYAGYSRLTPDPAAAIEARLIAVDVTVSGHTPFFDIDDIEVVDGITMISYGSDPHAEFLTPEGTLPGPVQYPAAAPEPVRLLLIYGFPKSTASCHLYYWGKQLTLNPVPIGESGLTLPYPSTQ